MKEGLGREERKIWLRVRASMRRILRLCEQALYWDMRVAETTAESGETRDEAKMDAAEVVMKQPDSRRAEQPAKAGTCGDGGA